MGFPACTRSAVTRCERSASYAGITRETPTCSFPSAAGQSALLASTASSSASVRPPRCHFRSTPTCCAMPAGSNSPMMATTRGPCSTTLDTRTFSTPSDTPKWRPTDSRSFGGTDDGGAGSIAPAPKILPFEEDDAPYRRDHSPTGGRTLRALRSRGPMPANRHLSRPDIVRDQVPAGDGTRFLGLRSCGPIAVSTSIISRFGLRLGGSSTGRAVAGTVVGSIIPSITLTGPPACASSEVLMYSIMASSSSSVSSLSRLLCWTLCSRGISRVRHRKYTPGCSRRTFAMAFSPCLRKSRRSAQMTSSLSLLREPRGRPAGLPDCPGCQRLVGMCVLAPCLLLCKYMIALLIRQSALIDAIVTRPFDPFQFEPPVRQGRADCAHDCAARLRRRLRSRSKAVHMQLGQRSCRSAVLAGERRSAHAPPLGSG